MITRDAFEGDQAQLDVHLAAMHHLASCARENGLDTRFTETMTRIFGNACTSGLGDMEIAASIKVLRGRQQKP